MNADPTVVRYDVPLHPYVFTHSTLTPYEILHPETDEEPLPPPFNAFDVKRPSPMTKEQIMEATEREAIYSFGTHCIEHAECVVEPDELGRGTRITRSVIITDPTKLVQRTMVTMDVPDAPTLCSSARDIWTSFKTFFRLLVLGRP